MDVFISSKGVGTHGPLSVICNSKCPIIVKQGRCIVIPALSATSGKPSPFSFSTPHPFSSMKAAVLGPAKDPRNLIFYLGSKSRQTCVTIPGLHPISRSGDFLNLMLVL